MADQVWAAFSDVDNYVEPFAGSLAVLLGRPDYHARSAETANDRDGYIPNFFRALAADPEGVAVVADRGVFECDLHAIHVWLVNQGAERIARLEGDMDYFDVKVAGLWVWGINAWIGGEWCSGKGPWQSIDGKLVKVGGGNGGNGGNGVKRQRPHLGTAGQGINRKLPHLGNGHAYSERKRPENLIGYFNALANRLRRVRVCCGDWSRILTDGACAYGDSVGVFLDPPYSSDVRMKDLYRTEGHDIAVAVREWALSRGNDRRYRIVLAGYHEEHAAAMPETWRAHRYSAGKAYGTTSAVGSGEGNDANRHNECLWFSPFCLTETDHLWGNLEPSTTEE